MTWAEHIGNWLRAPFLARRISMRKKHLNLFLESCRHLHTWGCGSMLELIEPPVTMAALERKVYGDNIAYCESDPVGSRVIYRSQEDAQNFQNSP